MPRIITPTETDWPIIKAFLESAGKGAVVLPPEGAGRLASIGIRIVQMEIDYDFDNSPEIALDIVNPDNLPESIEKAQAAVDRADKGPETAVLMAAGLSPSWTDETE